jgi:hypothetical protein
MVARDGSQIARQENTLGRRYSRFLCAPHTSTSIACATNKCENRQSGGRIG